jgi:hypothetical protein
MMGLKNKKVLAEISEQNYDPCKVSVPSANRKVIHQFVDADQRCRGPTAPRAMAGTAELRVRLVVVFAQPLPP